MKIEGIEITNPEKIIFPDIPVTKVGMVNYYAKIADRMLPYLKNRPLTLQRFPDGVHNSGFFQKHAQDHYPDFMKRIWVETEEGKAEEIICNSKKSLVYLANQGAVTFHTWLSRQNKLRSPDKVVFDLDPAGSADFTKVRKSAREVRDFLRRRGADPKVMTTGKSGLHVYYKIRASQDFDQIRSEVRESAEQIVQRFPDLFTLEMRKKKRGDKIFLDYLRNSYAQTSVCPFSLRPNKCAGVATPIDWEELDKIRSADQYTYQNIFRRLGAKAS